ncbi:hypothetical protein OHA44_38255 (plasmid) [Streptomyces sp. NBC_00144]|uniref:hypothetical protein n=1 Tax=Streptomyces sp. NBC_00144 TaxID=2975665 RepID=UPI003252F2AC
MQIETANDYEPLATIVTTRAPQARFMDEITAHAGADYHSVWLDETDNTVWHAWNEPGEDLWTLDHEPAGEAIPWITETLTLALEALASPEAAESYLDRAGREEDDLDALNELEAVRLAALRARSADPVDIDSMIRREMDGHREEIRRLSRLRATNLQSAFGTERGAAAAAARTLGVTRESARRALAAADEFDARVRNSAAQARQERQER